MAVIQNHTSHLTLYLHTVLQRQTVGERDRSRHFCHIASSHSQTDQKSWFHISNFKIKGHPSTAAVFLHVFLLPPFLHVSIHPPINLSSSSIRGIISALLSGRGLNPLNESMSDEGGHFKESPPPASQSLASFPGLPVLFHTSRTVEHQ